MNDFDSELNQPAWVEMEPGIWWWGEWMIEEILDYGFALTVTSGAVYGPFKTFADANKKAWEVRG